MRNVATVIERVANNTQRDKSDDERRGRQSHTFIDHFYLNKMGVTFTDDCGYNQGLGTQGRNVSKLDLFDDTHTHTRMQQTFTNGNSKTHVSIL